VKEKPFFPFGFYYHYDLLRDNISLLNYAASKNFTLVHVSSGFDMDLIATILNRSSELGLMVQYDLSTIWNDSMAVTSQVNLFKSSPALLSWYIAERPDGWDWDNRVNQISRINTLIKALDPYHPTTLLLTCKYGASLYQNTADIILTDPFPIGINTSCTDTGGDCGCDGCDGLPSDVATRIQTYQEALNYTKPLWIALQAYGNASSYWQRDPNPQEVRLMTYSSFIQGISIGVLYFQFPGVKPAVEQDLITMTKEVETMVPYFHNGFPYTVTSTVTSIKTRAWYYSNLKNKLVVGVNYNNTTLDFEILLQEKKYQGDIITIVPYNEMFIFDGTIKDTLFGFGVQAYLIPDKDKRLPLEIWILVSVFGGIILSASIVVLFYRFCYKNVCMRTRYEHVQ